MLTNIDDTVRRELTARIAFGEGIINTWSSATTQPPGMEQTARAHCGSAWFDIGVCRLLLGEESASVDAFHRAAECTAAALEIVSLPSLAAYEAALSAAVVAVDKLLALKLAGDLVAPEPRPSLVGVRLAWALALPALVNRDDSGAQSHVKAASHVPDKKAWYPGLGDAIMAVATGDRRGLTAALRRMLEKHVRYVRAKQSPYYSSAAGLVCVPATVLMRLAAWRRMGVGEIINRGANIPLVLVHSVGPSARVDIQVDFVPDCLTTA